MGLFTTEIKYQPNKKPKQGVYGEYLGGANTTPSLTNLSIVGMPTATYGANIPTTAEQPQWKPMNYQLNGATYGGNTTTPTEEKIYTEKIEPKYSDGNSDGNGTEGSTGDGNESKMTYGQWLDVEKKRQEDVYKDSLYTAQLNEERAIANAQSAYAQNKATYGTNAETLGQMGLTGGGYSDYLNAQAYSEKQNAVNTANINRLNAEKEAKATYEGNVSKLNQDYVDYQNSTYQTLLKYASDPTSGVTEELLDSLGKQAGLSEQEIADLKTVNKNATSQYETEIGGSGESDTIVIDDVINDIANGVFLNESGAKESWANIENALYAEKVSEEDIARAKQIYEWRELLDSGKVDQATFRKAIDAYQKAIEGDQEAIETIKKMGYATRSASKKTLKAQDEEARRIATEQLGIKASDIKDVVDVYNDISVKRFGSFAGSGSGKKQDAHIKQIIADAKAGKIEVGQWVDANLGFHAGATGTPIYSDIYIYVGDGLFVKATPDDIKNQNILSKTNKGHYATNYEN